MKNITITINTITFNNFNKCNYESHKRQNYEPPGTIIHVKPLV